MGQKGDDVHPLIFALVSRAPLIFVIQASRPCAAASIQGILAATASGESLERIKARESPYIQ